MSQRVTFVHMADVHIGAKFSYLPPELSKQRREEVKDTFAAMVQLAIGKRSQDKVDYVLLSGDIFDSSHPSLPDRIFVQHQLHILRQHDVEVFLISGNHDWYERGNFWDKETFPVTQHFTSYDFEYYEDKQRDTTIIGMGFDRKHTSKNNLSTFNFRSETTHSILLYHGAWQQASLELTRDYPFRTEDIEKLAVNYVALGHYHKFATILDRPQQKACYSGTPEGLDFATAELGKRFVVHGEIATNGEVFVTPIEINAKELQTLEFDCGLFSPTALHQEIQQYASPHRLLRVTLTGVPTVDLLLHLAEIRETFETSFAYLDIRDQTLALPRDLPVHDQTYVGLFTQRMKRAMEEAGNEEEQLLCKKALEYGLAAALSSER